MELSDLKASITNMSIDEMHELIGNIRANRRVSRTNRPKKVEEKSELRKSLRNISQEDAEDLLKLLEDL